MSINLPLLRAAQRIPISVWYTVACICGILWSSENNIIYALLPLILIEIIHRMHTMQRAHVIGMLAAFFFLGGLRLSQQEKRFLYYERILCSQPLSIQGRIVDIVHPAPQTTEITLQLSDMKNICIRITIQEQCALCMGDTITIPQIYLRAPREASMRQTLHKMNIVATGKMSSLATATVLPTTSWWHKTRHSLRNALLHKAQQDFSPYTAQLLTTLFLGYPARGAITSTKSLFERWGISHYLARSGLHIVIILSLLHLFFMLLPCTIIIRYLFSGLISIYYAYISWPTVSFMRALGTALWYTCCLLNRGIAVHTLHVISCITLITLIYQPLFLFSLDFQLSYALTATLLCIQQTELWALQRQG